jgi:hypothetical protein
VREDIEEVLQEIDSKMTIFKVSGELKKLNK